MQLTRRKSSLFIDPPGRIFQVAVFLLLTSIFSILVFLFRDPDFYWHTATAWLYHHGLPLGRESFTYTMPAFHWINHEWLFDWLSYYISPFLIVGASISASYFLLAKRRTITNFCLFLLGILPFLAPRPLFISILGYSFIYRFYAKKWFYYIFPVFFIFWSNMHAGFIFTIPVIFYLIYQRYRNILLPAIWLLFVAITTLTIGNGISTYVEIARTAFDRQLSARIGEWMPLYAHAGFKYGFISILLFIFVYFLVLTAKASKNDLKMLLLAFPVFLSVRYYTFFFPVVYGYMIDQKDIFSYEFKRATNRIRPYFYLSIVMLFLLYLIQYSNNRYYADQTIYSLTTLKCGDRIFADYNLAGWFEIRGFSVFIDGRMPSWSDQRGNILDRYIKVTDGDLSELAAHGVNCAVMGYKNQPFEEKARAVYTSGEVYLYEF